MELSKDLSAENIQFTKEQHILTDIAQETKNTPGFDSFSEDQLMEKVEGILLARIEKGDKQAYFQLGLFYYEQNVFEKARCYFDKARDFDYQSLYMLGVMLYDGIGGETQSELGVEYLKKVALSTSHHAKHLIHAAQYNIGRAYFQGYGVRRQKDCEAEKWWLLGAHDGSPQGSIKAQTCLGLFYSRDDDLDLKKAFFWHSEACGNGSVESQGALGVMYKYGIGVQKDTDSAYICLKEASDRGNVYAMGNLCAYYYARKLYTKAADLASRVSQLSDVELIARETDCLANYIKKGIAMACFYYARCLHEGHGIKSDIAEAKILYSRSFEFDADVCAQLQNITQHGVI